MAAKRSTTSGWIAPRSGGYSAVGRDATTGRFVTGSSVKRHAKTTAVEKKSPPPAGRGAAAVSGRKAG